MTQLEVPHNPHGNSDLAANLSALGAQVLAGAGFGALVGVPVIGAAVAGAIGLPDAFRRGLVSQVYDAMQEWGADKRESAVALLRGASTSDELRMIVALLDQHKFTKADLVDMLQYFPDPETGQVHLTNVSRRRKGEICAELTRRVRAQFPKT